MLTNSVVNDSELLACFGAIPCVWKEHEKVAGLNLAARLAQRHHHLFGLLRFGRQFEKLARRRLEDYHRVLDSAIFVHNPILNEVF